MAKASEDWTLGQGFRGSEATDDNETSTDGQQAGEVEFKGESLLGGKGPGWEQTTTPGSSASRSGRKVGVKIDVNGYGGGIKSKRFPDGQANSNDLNRDTGHGDPVADGDGEDATLDNVAPPGGHSDKRSGYGRPGAKSKS